MTTAPSAMGAPWVHTAAKFGRVRCAFCGACRPRPCPPLTHVCVPPQSYVRSVRYGSARVPQTLAVALDRGAADEDFSARLLKFQDDALRVLGDYDTYVLLTS